MQAAADLLGISEKAACRQSGSRSPTRAAFQSQKTLQLGEGWTEALHSPPAHDKEKTIFEDEAANNNYDQDKAGDFLEKNPDKDGADLLKNNHDQEVAKTGGLLENDRGLMENDHDQEMAKTGDLLENTGADLMENDHDQDKVETGADLMEKAKTATDKSAASAEALALTNLVASFAEERRNNLEEDNVPPTQPSPVKSESGFPGMEDGIPIMPMVHRGLQQDFKTSKQRVAKVKEASGEHHGEPADNETQIKEGEAQDGDHLRGRGRGRGSKASSSRGRAGRGAAGAGTRAMKRPAASILETSSSTPPLKPRRLLPDLAISSDEEVPVKIEQAEEDDQAPVKTELVQTEVPKPLAKAASKRAAKRWTPKKKKTASKNDAKTEQDTNEKGRKKKGTKKAAEGGERAPPSEGPETRLTFAGRRPPKTISAFNRFSALSKTFRDQIVPQLAAHQANSKMQAS